jgi:HEAT repeat protein
MRDLSCLFLAACVQLCCLSAEVADDWIEETIFRLEDMKGEERQERILKACEMKDKRLAGVLARVLLAAEDPDKVKDRIAEALCKTPDESLMGTITKICESDDLELKERGLKIMGHLRTAESVEFLKQRAQASFPEEKAAALEALGYSGRKELIPYLEKALRDGAGEEKTAARMSLARLGVVSVIPALLQDHERTHGEREQLDSEQQRAMRLPDGREKTRTLNRIGQKQKRVFRTLREQRFFFLDIPPTAIPFFVKAANEDPLAFSLALILENLPRMANAENAGLFLGLLHNKHPLIRTRALDILEKYRTPELEKQVQAVLREQLGSDDWHLRFFAVQSIYWVPEADRTPALLKCLDDPSRAVRIAAISQLGKHRAKEAEPGLRRILAENQDVDVVVACRDAIALLAQK